jgi:SAM-dependent methyltransferase
MPEASAPRCRSCATPLSHLFADLGLSPISNAFRRPADLDKVEPFYPLRAYVCEACKLVQLQDFHRADDLFTEEYAYFSSFSTSWLKHAERYAEAMTARFGLGADSRVVELASNDGYLLQYFKARGINVLGIEPSANVAEVAAAKRGIPSVVKFFGRQTARELAAEGVAADLMCANNVLAHVPDINDFVGGIPIVLKKTGLITFEFPHLLRLIEQNQFDTIYHEHYSYLSLLAVERILDRHGLVVFDIEELPTHGGSLRVYAAHAGHGFETSRSVAKVRADEAAAGLDGLEAYAAFGERVRRTKRALLKYLIECKDKGLSVVGYGAPAKGNTLLNYCGVRTDMIDYTVDVSPHKQGLYLPGTAIPIMAPERIYETRPDVVLILPWNLKDEITEQMAKVRSWGGRFVVPIPEVREV